MKINEKPKISTHWNKIGERKKFIPGISETVPGQSMKLSDVLNKVRVGMPTHGYRPIYSENPELDEGINPKTLDYVDIQNLSNENLRKLNKLQADRKALYEAHEQEMLLRKENELKDKLRKEILAENDNKD